MFFTMRIFCLKDQYCYLKKLSPPIDADLFVAVLILIFLIVLYNSPPIPEYAMLQF